MMNVDNIINMSFIPSWYKLWLVVSSILVVWDCLYIFYRPDTMKGGKYFQYFFPYETYIQIDTLYGNLTDSFVVLQSQCNVVEIILVVLSMLVYAGKSIRAKSAGSLLCLVASCFTFWKTVIYVMYGYKGLVFAKGNELIVLGAFIIPTACWLVFPVLGIFAIGDRLINQIDKLKSAKQA
jgi:hypothetical protein